MAKDIYHDLVKELLIKEKKKLPSRLKVLSDFLLSMIWKRLLGNGASTRVF